MTALAVSTIRVWSAPTRPTRRYRTKHAAFVGWAKDLIRKHGEGCGCEAGDWNTGPGHSTCPWHKRLHTAPAFACTACGTPDSDVAGTACGTCCTGGRCTIPTTVPSSERYMRLRNRLARWLRWMSERRSEAA